MSWWRYAKPGDKVVCVDSDVHEEWQPPWASGGDMGGLCKSKTYTIEDVYYCEFHSQIVISVYEIRREFEGKNAGFDVLRFRPVQTKSTETGMRILRKIAAGEREPA